MPQRYYKPVRNREIEEAHREDGRNGVGNVMSCSPEYSKIPIRSFDDGRNGKVCITIRPMEPDPPRSGAEEALLEEHMESDGGGMDGRRRTAPTDTPAPALTAAKDRREEGEAPGHFEIEEESRRDNEDDPEEV